MTKPTRPPGCELELGIFLSTNKIVVVVEQRCKIEAGLDDVNEVTNSMTGNVVFHSLQINVLRNNVFKKK